MSETELSKIAEKADMIVDSYAFTKKENGISIVNLKKADHSMFISNEGKMLETNMDEIERAIVLNIWTKDKEYMEPLNA